MNRALVASPLGFLVGLSLGALGSGGSILAVPFLVHGAGQTPQEATATSLLLVVECGGVFPPKDTTVQTRLRLVDGLPGPSGPVTTSVKTWNGSSETTLSPQRQNLIVLLSGFEYSSDFDLSLIADGAIDGPDESQLRPFAALMIAMVDGLSVQYALDPDGADVDAAIALWERMIRCLFQDMQMVDRG